MKQEFFKYQALTTPYAAGFEVEKAEELRKKEEAKKKPKTIKRDRKL